MQSRGTPEFLVMEPMNPVPGPSCHRRLNVQTAASNASLERQLALQTEDGLAA